MGLRLKEERKQEVLLPTVLLHPKVPVEQDIHKSLLCRMQQKVLQKGIRRGMSQVYLAELIGSGVGSMSIYMYTHVHTQILHGRYQEILSKTEEQRAAWVCLCTSLLQDAGEQSTQNIIFTVSTTRQGIAVIRAVEMFYSALCIPSLMSLKNSRCAAIWQRYHVSPYSRLLGANWETCWWQARFLMISPALISSFILWWCGYPNVNQTTRVWSASSLLSQHLCCGINSHARSDTGFTKNYVSHMEWVEEPTSCPSASL